MIVHSQQARMAANDKEVRIKYTAQPSGGGGANPDDRAKVLGS